ncbi:MAG: SH3 domain-containing protein, partial [Clostridiaceae bacterium]|nr:SH3 domain-containing protein [Clostridiaceae bacterium]
ADEDFNDFVDDEYLSEDEWESDISDYDDEDEYEYEEDYYEGERSSNVRRNVIYAILILICIVCIYALARMFFFSDDPNDAEETESISIDEPAIINTDEDNVRTPVQPPASDEVDTEEPTDETGTPDTGDTDDTDITEPSGELQAGGTGTVNTEILNIRSEPNTDGAVAGVLVEGSAVQILDVVDDWYYIQTAEGIEGYVFADYID